MFGNKKALIDQYKAENRELRKTINDLGDTVFHLRDKLLNIGDLQAKLDYEIADGLWGKKNPRKELIF